MKRSHSNITPSLSEIPKTDLFKSTLIDRYLLKVKNVYDISKPRDKPIEAIDEPDEEDVAKVDHLNKSNARMLLLELQDCNNSEIKAIETEKIDHLSNIKPNFIIEIAGPVEIRCGNIMLEKKHVLNIEPGPTTEDVKASKNIQPNPMDEHMRAHTNIPTKSIDEDPILSNITQPASQSKSGDPVVVPSPTIIQGSLRNSANTVKTIEVIDFNEDWDDDDEDDCIILD